MADLTERTTRTCFRLRGEVEGRVVSFALQEGEYRIGALPENDFVLPVDAVSRRHALIRCDHHEVLVNDLNSKNGTWVNGVRVQKAVLKPGDWLGLGPVVLVLEEMDPEDAELAIGLARRASDRAARDSKSDTKTRARRREDEPPEWVTLLSRLVSLTVGVEDPELGPAVEALQEELGASSVLLAECSRPELTVLASSGGVVSPPDALVDRARGLRGAGAGKGLVVAGLSQWDPPWAWAIGLVDDTPPWLLGVVGDFPHRAASKPLLEAVLRLLLHARPDPVHLGAGPERPGQLPDLVVPPEHVIGRSQAMGLVYDQLRQLVRGDIPVLIVGETGVGKEHIAQILHASSPRAAGPFVAVNCAAIPSELLEAELFGIERGVATGVSARPGKFQLAEGGTLFLDEIGDMSLDLQAKLLRALQEMEVHPLGSRLPQPIDVRVVTATNTNLSKRIADGRFRRDLYYRVAGFTLEIPPSGNAGAISPPLWSTSCASTRRRLRSPSGGSPSRP